MESSGGNPICMVRPAALAEPDLERYTIRLPARVFGGGVSRHVKQIIRVVMDRVRSVSGHVSLICYLAPAPLRSPRITGVHRYYGRLRLPILDALSLAL